MRRGLSLCILSGLAALSIASAAPTPASAQSGPPISIGILEATPAFYDLPVYALTQMGNEFGLKVEVLELQGGGETGAVFAGGHGDILMAGMDKAFGFYKEKLVEQKVFGVVLTSANWSLVAPAKSSIKTMADLKGKTIGISGPGSSSDMLVKWATRKAGLDPAKDVELIALGSVANLYAGVENDRVAAAVLVSPFLQKAVQGGMARVIGDWEGMSYPNSVFMARTKDLKSDPQKFIRFQAALKVVLGRFKDDRAFALSIAKKRYPNAKPEELNAQLDHAIATLWKPMDGEMTKELYNNAQDVMVGSGRLKQSDIPPFEELVVNLPAK